MEKLYPLIRTLHVLATSFWIGEVAVINFILIPVVSKLTGESRKQFIIQIFPRIFNLASALSATAVITGLFLVYYRVNGHWYSLLSGKWGLSILIGGSMGILLTFFHFFMENRLAAKIGLGKNGNDAELDDVHTKLKIVPRLGLLVITTIFLLMINASHGIF